MPDYLPGSTVTATDTPPAVSSVVDPSFTATITAYGTATSGGTYSDCAVTFTAPTSGRVVIHCAARLISTASGNGARVCVETREGSTVGSGTIVDGVGDRGPSNYNAVFVRVGTSRMLSGLTPGAAYNARMLHRVDSGSGSFALRELIVSPTS